MEDSRVKKLTKKQKLDLLDALEAKRLKAQTRRDLYKPHAGQLPIHKSNKYLRYIAAANAFGKSCFAVNEVLARAKGYNPWLEKHTPVPARIIVGLDQPIKVETVWLAELSKWQNMKELSLEKRGKPYVSAIVFPNGSEVLFTFAESEPMVWESLEADFLVFDEPPPRNMFVALMRSLRKKQGDPKCIIIGTPITMPWLRVELYEPWVKGERPEMDFFRGTSAQNASNLGEDYIENFSKFLTDKEKRIRLSGEFFDLDDLALASVFDRVAHIIPSDSFRWPPNWPVVVAIDVAMAKPHVALMLGVTKDEQFIVLKELSSKTTAPDFAVKLKEFMAGYRITDIVVDSLGSSELSGGDGRLSFIASLQKNGIQCRATTYAEKDDGAWLSMIREVLHVPAEPDNFGKKEPKLKILDSCRRLISDIETVSWQRVKHGDDQLKPKLDISKKDALSCLKYALAAQPSSDKGRERVIRSKHGVGLNSRDPVLKSIKKGRSSW